MKFLDQLIADFASFVWGLPLVILLIGVATFYLYKYGDEHEIEEKLKHENLIGCIKKCPETSVRCITLCEMY